MFWVYLITNTVNGKQYVGVTSRSVELRFKEHLRRSSDVGAIQALPCAIRKYGCDAFEISALAEVDTWEEACAKEVETILELGTKAPKGYNLTEGGEGSLGLRHSAETSAKISAANKGVIRSDAYKVKMSEAKRKQTSETRAKISEANRLRVISDLTRAKMSDSAKRRKREVTSQATRDKQSASMKAYWERKRKEKETA